MTHPGRTLSLLSLTAGCLALAGTASAQSTAQMPAKLKKQITVMEKVIDEVLVDSKNLLVANHEPTRGVYLPEFGVLFTLDAQILSPDRGEWWKDWNKKFKVETDKHGNTVVHLNNDDDDDDDSDKADNKKDKEKRELTKKELLKDREERYEKGKTEIRDALTEYGYTLTGLRDDQWVAIVAYIDDDDMFGDNEGETVLMRAKMSDLRSHDAGKLSDDAMASRVSIEEY
ncbi:MAG TPA: hypothetical protein VE910_04365 [Dongiaceae bacterium]|jgi:hypothetical protein|nr:hypothetical protein [Dongiaceae bacterium]